MTQQGGDSIAVGLKRLEVGLGWLRAALVLPNNGGWGIRPDSRSVFQIASMASKAHRGFSPPPFCCSTARWVQESLRGEYIRRSLDLRLEERVRQLWAS